MEEYTYQADKFVFHVRKDLLYSADDMSLFQGNWGGIGFYSAYKDGVFHMDNLKICVET